MRTGQRTGRSAIHTVRVQSGISCTRHGPPVRADHAHARTEAISRDARGNRRRRIVPRGLLAYVAYFGTYTVDATKGTVTHHVEGSLRPDYTGTDQVRPFRVDGDQLIIEIRQGQQYLRRELIRVK